MIACDTGTSGAPKAPCSTRQPTRASIEPAKPQAKVAMVKPATQAVHSSRQPKRSASQPASGVATAVATRLAVTTQAIWSCVADSAPWICGSDTVAAVMLIAYRNVTAVQVARTRARCVAGLMCLAHCKPGT